MCMWNKNEVGIEINCPQLVIFGNLLSFKWENKAVKKTKWNDAKLSIFHKHNKSKTKIKILKINKNWLNIIFSLYFQTNSANQSASHKCVFMCVYVCVCQQLYLFAYTCANIITYECVCVWICRQAYLSVYVCMSGSVYMCEHVCEQTYLTLHTYICMCIWVQI